MDQHGPRRIARAFDLAARVHTGQARKGSAKEPSINHVADVAARLAQSPDADEPTLRAAILHDVVEDTGHGLGEIAAAFGAEVVGLVAVVTDDKSLPKAERKRLQVADAPGRSRGPSASSSRTRHRTSRRWWTRPRAPRPSAAAAAISTGRGRSREVVAGLKGADPVLEDAFDREAARLEAALDKG